MRPLLTILVVFTLVTARAAAAGAEELRVGYVDMDRAINETSEGQAAKKKLLGIKETKQKELDEKQNELKKMQDDIEKQRTLLKPDVLSKRQQDWQEKLVQLQQAVMRHQKELTDREAEMMNGILNKMSGIIGQVAQQENLTLIVDKRTLLWAKPSLDLTNEVIRRYNASAGGAGASAPKSPPPKTGKK